MRLPAHEYLDRLKIPYRALEFPPSTEKGAANVSRALGFEESRMVKTLIFVTGDGEPILVMVGADKSVVSGHLKKAVGDRNMRLAPPDVVEGTTGYAVGSVPPFHWQAEGFRSFVDAALMDEPSLGVGAGVWGQEIIIAPTDLVAASRAEVVNLTDKTAPVRKDP